MSKKITFPKTCLKAGHRSQLPAQLSAYLGGSSEHPMPSAL